MHNNITLEINLIQFCELLYQSGLYSALKNSVSSFRIFVGAPDNPRWNSVLFGGKIFSLYIFEMLNLKLHQLYCYGKLITEDK